MSELVFQSRTKGKILANKWGYSDSGLSIFTNPSLQAQNGLHQDFAPGKTSVLKKHKSRKWLDLLRADFENAKSLHFLPVEILPELAQYLWGIGRWQVFGVAVAGSVENALEQARVVENGKFVVHQAGASSCYKRPPARIKQ